MTTLTISRAVGAAPQSTATRIDAEGFASLFRGHPSGVSVITAEGSAGPVALTASSVASISLDPPLLIFSVSAQSSAAPSIIAADSVVVHLLDADDLDLAELAATSGADRFADRDRWTRLITGEPVYHGVRAWTRATIVDRIQAGGSTVIVAHAREGAIARSPEHEAGPLVHHNRTWHRLGEGSAI